MQVVKPEGSFIRDTTGKCIHRRTHGRISLEDTATHSTEQTSGARTDAGVDGGALNLRRGQEQDRALGRRFNPSLQKL
jgi:hypothetical protein